MEDYTSLKLVDSEYEEWVEAGNVPTGRSLLSLKIGPRSKLKLRRVWFYKDWRRGWEWYRRLAIHLGHDEYSRTTIVIPLLVCHMVVAVKQCENRECLTGGWHVRQ